MTIPGKGHKNIGDEQKNNRLEYDVVEECKLIKPSAEAEKTYLTDAKNSDSPRITCIQNQDDHS